MSDSPDLWPDEDRPSDGPSDGPSDRPGGTDILTEERVAPISTDAGDHERFSHYVQKDKIVESAVLGHAVVALCGKVWVPSRDPQKFPVCPECKQIWESLPRGGGGGDDSE